jgi:hypothetical protein
MSRQCQAAAVIKTSKSRIKEFFRRFVKKVVFADNIYVDMIAVQDYITHITVAK